MKVVAEKVLTARPANVVEAVGVLKKGLDFIQNGILPWTHPDDWTKAREMVMNLRSVISDLNKKVLSEDLDTARGTVQSLRSLFDDFSDLHFTGPKSTAKLDKVLNFINDRVLVELDQAIARAIKTTKAGELTVAASEVLAQQLKLNTGVAFSSYGHSNNAKQVKSAINQVHKVVGEGPVNISKPQSLGSALVFSDVAHSHVSRYHDKPVDIVRIDKYVENETWPTLDHLLKTWKISGYVSKNGTLKFGKDYTSFMEWVKEQGAKSFGLAENDFNDIVLGKSSREPAYTNSNLQEMVINVSDFETGSGLDWESYAKEIEFHISKGVSQAWVTETFVLPGVTNRDTASKVMYDYLTDKGYDEEGADSVSSEVSVGGSVWTLKDLLKETEDMYK